MLASSYRLAVENESGNTITVAGTLTPWKFDSNGALDYSIGSKSQAWTVAPADGAGPDPADAAIDNTTDKGLGAHGEVTITGTGSGDVYVYLQQSHDGGTTWADVYSNPLATATLGGSGKIVEFEI